MVSIGIPIYKTEFLRDAILSVLAQTYSNIELILVNSYANERAEEIVAHFHDPRIRYYQDTTHPSIIENWNKVLTYARGEYFVLFSDDDLYEPDFVREMKRLAQNYKECEIFHCRVRRMDALGKTLSLAPLCPEFETGLEFINGRLKSGRIHFAPDFFCKTDSLRSIGGFADLPLAWGSDDLTWFQLALRHGIAYSPRPLVSWRVSAKQVSRVGDLKARMDAVDIYQEWMRGFLQDYHPKDVHEKEIITDLQAGLSKTFLRQKHYLFNVATETGNLKELARFYFENHLKYGLKFSWLARSVINKSLNRRME